MNDKPTRKITNKVPKPTGIAALIEWGKQHPSIILAAAAGLGISSEQLKSLLAYEGPAWMLGGVVILWALFNAGREHLNQQRKVADAVEALQEGFAEFRNEVRAQLDNGAGQFEQLNTRVGKVEAELAAHIEDSKRG